MPRVVVTGATGTIGRAVCRALIARGDRVVALSRDRERAKAILPEGIEVYTWADPVVEPPPATALEDSQGVLHLLGEPVAQRWSEAARTNIRDSRVCSTALLGAALRELPAAQRPGTLVSQSATGFYGPSDDRLIDEDSPQGRGFLADVVGDWEAEAASAGDTIRVAMTRTGVVLSRAGGALEKMLPFFRLGIGGPVAGGRQYVPWIHLDDVVAGLLVCLDDPALRGPVNLTAPNPVTNGEMSRALGSVLRRPAVLPVPALALRALYGEMAQIVTTGQRVIPRRLSGLGFEFRFPLIEPALRDALAHSS